MTWTLEGPLVVSSTTVTLAYCRGCHKNSSQRITFLGVLHAMHISRDNLVRQLSGQYAEQH